MDADQPDRLLLVAGRMQITCMSIAAVCGNKVVVDLRTDVYRQVQRLPLKFYDKRRPLEYVAGDQRHHYLQKFLVNGVQDIAVQTLRQIGIIAIMFSIHWQSGAAGAAAHPIVAFVTTKFSQRMHKVYHRLLAPRLQHACGHRRYDPWYQSGQSLQPEDDDGANGRREIHGCVVTKT